MFGQNFEVKVRNVYLGEGYNRHYERKNDACRKKKTLHTVPQCASIEFEFPSWLVVRTCVCVWMCVVCVCVCPCVRVFQTLLIPRKGNRVQSER